MKALLSPSESLLITETLCKLNDYLLAKLAAVYWFGSYGLDSKVVNAQLRFGKQSRLLTIVIAVVVLLLLGAPLVVLFVTSLRPPTALPLDPGISLENFETIVSSPRMVQVLINTAIYGAGALILSLTLGAIIAFLVERTDIPFRSAIYSAMLVSLAVPTMLKAFGWVLLLSPGLGWINHLLRQGLGLEGTSGPLNIYTMYGMIFVTGIGLSNNAFLMLSPLFRQMNPEFEEAAQTSGSKGFTVLRKVTLPLLLPGLLSALIYFGMVLVQVMETALAIGVPGGIRVLSVHIYLLTKAEQGLPMYALAAAFGVVLLLLALALMALYFWLTRQQERFSVVTGRSFRPRQLKLGRWKYIAFAFVMIVVACYAMPMLILVWASLVKVYQAPSLEALSQVSLQSYVPHLRQSAGAAERDQHSDADGDRAHARGLPCLLRQLVLGQAEDEMGRSLCDNAHGRAQCRPGARFVSDLRADADPRQYLGFDHRSYRRALAVYNARLELRSAAVAQRAGGSGARHRRDHRSHLAHGNRAANFTRVVERLAVGVFRYFERFYLCHISHDRSEYGSAFSDVGSVERS